MKDDIVKELTDVIEDAVSNDAARHMCENAARAALAYLASRPLVEAGPEVSDVDPLPWRHDQCLGIRDATDTKSVASYVNGTTADAIVHRVNNWTTLRAQLVATRAEVERLRAALTDAVEGMADMRPYVDDHFAEKRDHDGYLARGRAALGKP